MSIHSIPPISTLANTFQIRENIQPSGKTLVIAAIGISILLGLGALFYQALMRGNRNANQPNPTVAHKPTPPTPTITPPPPHKPVSDPLLAQFESEIVRTMGGHILDDQRKTLIALFHQAMKAPSPKQEMENLINQKINQPKGWGNDKASHIKKNLLPLFPIGSAAPSIPMPDSPPPAPADTALLAQFEDQMERTMGKHLSDSQKKTLIALFHQAMKADSPRNKMEILINQMINQPNGWGSDKANNHIKRHLLPIMPAGVFVPPAVGIPTPAPVDAALLARFEDQMERTMGKHLSTGQKKTLIDLFHLAMKTDSPQNIMETLINQKINQPDGWGNDKASHIKINLLPIMPAGAFVAPTPAILAPAVLSVRDIANTPIDQNGNKLVCFYKTGPTEFLGNFALCPYGLTIWGQTFRCAEAAFQWRKYALAAQQHRRMDMQNDPKLQEFFTADGEEAFRIRQYFDHQYSGVDVKGWRNGIRDTAMWEALKAKFDQNPTLAAKLQDTSGAYLMEHNKVKGRDTYWSNDSDGTGNNRLGKMLMALRDGTACPPPGDTSDQSQLQYYAQYANQPGNLNYSIF